MTRDDLIKIQEKLTGLQKRQSELSIMQSPEVKADLVKMQLDYAINAREIVQTEKRLSDSIEALLAQNRS